MAGRWGELPVGVNWQFAPTEAQARLDLGNDVIYDVVCDVKARKNDTLRFKSSQ
jgi:hypothetical protein